MPTAKKKTRTKSKQTDADRAADARRYQRDKPKRIAAVKRSQEKDPDFPAKRKARAKVNNAVRDGKMEKPAGKDFHHTSYSGDKPKGKWEDRSKHRRRPNTKKK